MIKRFQHTKLKKFIHPKKPTLETKDIMEEEKEHEVDIKVLRGKRGPKGEPGDRRTDKQVQELIKPLIPKPIPGKDGEDGKEGKEGKMGPQGPRGRDGIGKDGLPGMPGKDGSPDTPKQIRDKIESLKKGEKLSIHAIEELAEIIEELKKQGKAGRDIGLLKGSIHTGIGKEIRFIDDETPSGTIDGANAEFTLEKNPKKGSVKVYRGGARQRVTEDYTISGKTITFIIAPQVGEVILVDYRY